jgi:hypothetical protein
MGLGARSQSERLAHLETPFVAGMRRLAAVTLTVRGR